MELKILHADIVTLHVDAIVNAANRTLLGGGGVDGAIHAAAGPELLTECRTLKGCQTGDAKITKGYNLPAKYVIHAVGPVWLGGTSNEKEKLTGCYRKSMQLAQEHNIKSIAFPLISGGAFGYPKREAITVAITTLQQYENTGIQMYLVLYDEPTYTFACEVFADIKAGR